MATKAEEKKALEQIKKIIDGLGGSNSYIGMALEGCFEIAESNIENDFGCSMQEQVRAMEKSRNDWMARCKYMELEHKKAVQELEATKDNADALNKWGNDKANELRDAMNEVARLTNKNLEATKKAEALELENMKLKARLYDLMMADK